MPTLPAASLTINETADALASGQNYIVVMAPVAQSADSVPRIFASTSGLLTQYTYAPGVDYCAMHFSETDLPVIFVGLPISTPGAVTYQNNSAVGGTSNIAVAAGASGCMEAVSGRVTIVTGGTVGTDQITFDLSCDGGETTQRVRLGTGTSYSVPYLGMTINFGGGTLIQGDLFEWGTSAPMWGTTAINTAASNLTAQQNGSRSWLVVGSVPSSTYAGYVVTAVDSYATEDERFNYARVQIADKLHAQSSKVQYRMTGAPSITFAEAGHTITRATGSFITDGFAIGQIVQVAGSAANSGVIGALTNVSATVLTFASGITADETDAVGVSITASNGFTFASGTPDTITRTAGSFLTEGFAVGQSVTISGTADNNVTATITVLTGTVMSFASGIAAEGPLLSSAVSITQSTTYETDVAAQTASYASIDGEKRTDIAYGHARKESPITGWDLRRPAAWACSIREYQHDVQIPTYRKSDGPLTGWSLTDDNGNIVEYDERTVGGALAGRFTCLRTYANGPLGAFVALSLTRDTEGALLSRTHNMAVANLASTVIQTTTENAIGSVLQLNADGTGTDASLKLLEGMVNRQLQINLLQQFEEGPRASNAVWTASRTDVLNTVGATLTGTCALTLDGTLENIATSLAVS